MARNICSVDGCNVVVAARRLCRTHYAWHARHGSLPPLQPRAEGCSVEDCDLPHEARGWCKLHYQRWQQTGTTDEPVRPGEMERFWVKVDRGGPDDCWPWLASTTKQGYGTFRYDGTSGSAHRFAYSRLVGPIPNEMEVDHLCRNPACVNPDHLEVVTRSENENRKRFALYGDACQRGHRWTSETTYIHPKRGTRSCKVCALERSR